jgi:hypothetical protein
MFGMLVVAKLTFSAAQLRLEMSTIVMFDYPWYLLAWIELFKGLTCTFWGSGIPIFSNLCACVPLNSYNYLLI